MLRRRMMGKKGLYKIADRPEDLGLLFQWGHAERAFWPNSLAATDPAAQVGEYTNTWDTPKKDTFDDRIVPGWVLPTDNQMRSLINSKPYGRGQLNGIGGYWFGKENMLEESIFFPSTGARDWARGDINTVAYYWGFWTSESNGTNNAFYAHHGYLGGPNRGSFSKSLGISLRLVKPASYVWDGVSPKDFVEIAGVKWAKANVTAR